MSSESPLNIRAGPHPGRTGTRLNGRIRETGRSGQVELRVDQDASRASANAMLPPGPMGPAQVKSCERYRCDHQGSILPIPMHGRPNPEGQAFPLRFRTREGGRGLTAGKRKEEGGRRKAGSGSGCWGTECTDARDGFSPALACRFKGAGFNEEHLDTRVSGVGHLDETCQRDEVPGKGGK